MKKFYTLFLLAIASLCMVSAQNTTDTIFLTNGKFYICSVLDANPKYVQYSTVMMKSNIDEIKRGKNKHTMSDIIRTKNGKEIACQIISETANKVYYAKNYPTSHVASIHMNNGNIISSSDFGNLDYTDDLNESDAEYFPTESKKEEKPEIVADHETQPVVVSKTIVSEEKATVAKQETIKEEPKKEEPVEQKYDLINLLNGEIIECQILSLTEDAVLYRLKNSPNIQMSVKLEKVATIFYSNGYIDSINDYM